MSLPFDPIKVSLDKGVVYSQCLKTHLAGTNAKIKEQVNMFCFTSEEISSASFTIASTEQKFKEWILL